MAFIIEIWLCGLAECLLLQWLFRGVHCDRPRPSSVLRCGAGVQDVLCQEVGGYVITAGEPTVRTHPICAVT